MKRVLGVLLGLAFVLAVGVAVTAQSGGLKLVQVVPADLTFTQMPNGTLQAIAIGDPSKAEPYAIRVRIPAGTRVQPHFHPEERIVLVLTGKLYVGFGGQFTEASMKALPPGSVFTEPARQPHYTWAKDGAVVLHVTGVGPTGTTEAAAR